MRGGKNGCRGGEIDEGEVELLWFFSIFTNLHHPY